MSFSQSGESQEDKLKALFLVSDAIVCCRSHSLTGVTR
jgi:hypothetical protein